MTQVNGNGRARLINDVALWIFVASLAFYAGVLTNRVDKHDARGGVQISMEADQRLTRLEEQQRALDRRIENLERRP